MRKIYVYDWGIVPYEKIYRLQLYLHGLRAREPRLCDFLLFGEHHPPVLTWGREGIERSIPKGLKTLKVDRGGGGCLHLPGQVVFYPVLNLRDVLAGDLSRYIYLLEEVMRIVISRLYGLFAFRIDGHRGNLGRGEKGGLRGGNREEMGDLSRICP